MTMIDCNSFFRVSIPYTYRIVIATGGNRTTIWGPGYRLNCALMAFVDRVFEPDTQCYCPQPVWPGSGIPYLNRLIMTCRGDPLSIWRPCYARHYSVMVMIGERIVSAQCIPHLHTTILTRRGNPLSIG